MISFPLAVAIGFHDFHVLPLYFFMSCLLVPMKKKTFISFNSPFASITVLLDTGMVNKLKTKNNS